ICADFSYLYYHCYHLYSHSFPTRRSSDLCRIQMQRRHAVKPVKWRTRQLQRLQLADLGEAPMPRPPACPPGHQRMVAGEAGEQQIGRAHAELQSRENLVCRLLLEKKKKRE